MGKMECRDGRGVKENIVYVGAGIGSKAMDSQDHRKQLRLLGGGNM